MLVDMPYVFQKVGLGLFNFNDFRNVKKKCTSRILKTFLESNLAERLTRKAGGQNIKVRNLPFIDFRDISFKIPVSEQLGRFFLEIVLVGLTGMLVPLGRKNALCSQIMEG